MSSSDAEIETLDIKVAIYLKKYCNENKSSAELLSDAAGKSLMVADSAKQLP
jgi:hypothetical protein